MEKFSINHDWVVAHDKRIPAYGEKGLAQIEVRNYRHLTEVYQTLMF